METQSSISKTPKADDPSASVSFLCKGNPNISLPVLPLMEESLTGSSSVSQTNQDSLAVEVCVEDETVDDSRLPELPLTSPPLSPLSSFQEAEPSRSLAPFNYTQTEEDTFSWTCDVYDSSNRWSSMTSSPSRTEITPTGVGAGLRNLGNTCFINAVLQCFTHTVPFVLGLRSLYHGKPCPRNTESFCILCAMRDHIELSLNSSGGTVSPCRIFENLNYLSSDFKKFQQEDAHEFLQSLLDRLESCCSSVKLNGLSSQNGCLIKNVFGGRLVSKLSCCNCGHISYSYEPFNDLSLEIESVDNLTDALKSFTNVEKIEDPEVKFRCEECKEMVSIEKQLMLDHAPSVATFHLKRFKTNQAYVEKIDKHVAFPLALDLQPYTFVNQKSTVELKYHLYAVVKHSGFFATSGHYICYVRSSPNTWHRLDDSRVTGIKEEFVLSQEAYILFYARQDIPWFSTTIEVQGPCTQSVLYDCSPTSVLDDLEMECPSNIEVSDAVDCKANESKDGTVTQFSCERQHEVEVDKSHGAAKDVSVLAASESEFHVSKSIGSRDDKPIVDISTTSGSSNCSGEIDENASSVPHIRDNNYNQNADEVTDNNCLMDSSNAGCSPVSHLKDKKINVNKKAVNKPVMDQGRIEAMRYTKRMPSARGSKFLALLATENDGKVKKRRGSSPCKRFSPRRRHTQGHSSLMQHPVTVTR